MNYQKLKWAVSAMAVTLGIAFSSSASAVVLWGNSASFSGVDVEAFNSADGTLLKQFNQIGGVTGNGRGVVVVGNTVYYTRTSDPHIYKADATTGAALGSILTSNASISGRVITPEPTKPTRSTRTRAPTSKLFTW
jgi:outer membrane protein assembly factor BamB